MVALGLSGVINLAVVGLVVNQYGLAVYGTLLLLRLFMPGQLISLFDFGLPEAVTRGTARGLASDQGRQAMSLYLTAICFMMAISLLLALPLVLFPAGTGGLILALDPAETALLAPALLAHGLALPLLVAGDLSGSALKGQEAFKGLRWTDMSTAIAYGITALCLVTWDAGPLSIALAYLGWQGVKSLLWIWLSLRGFARHGHSSLKLDFSLIWFERAYLRALILQRINASATTQLPRIVMAQALGSAAVGLFEAIMRVPRFLKSLTTVTTSVVMPVVARLNATGSTAELERLAVAGPRLLLAFASLISLPFICLAQPFIALWMGPEVGPYWPWFAVLCILPLTAATAGFWNAMGKAELKTLRRQNVVGWAQAALFFAIALPLMGSLQTVAFWLALLCSSALTIPALIAIMARRYGLSPLSLAAPIASVLVASLPAAAAGAALAHWVALDDWLHLVPALGVVALVQALMLALFVVQPEERRSLLRFKRS